MAHHLQVKIYYEDTDCGGVVYYANYLKYCERARTEFLEDGGLSMKALADEGILFVVAEAALKYFAPAKYADVLDVKTDVASAGAASIVFRHDILRLETGEKLVEATVKLVCVTPALKPVRMPAAMRDLVGKALEPDAA